MESRNACYLVTCRAGVCSDDGLDAENSCIVPFVRRTTQI